MTWNIRTSDEESKQWAKHIGWTALSAVCAAIGTKLGEWVIEEVKAARKLKKD